jgi:nucleosome assembly protein 1-like 1
MGQMMELMKQKRKKHLEELTEDQKLKVVDLNKIQDSLSKIQKDFDEEFAKLEKKYEDLKLPFFKQRGEIVNETKEDKFVGLPNFWYHVLKNSEVFADILSKRDEESLKYLTEIVCTEFEDEKVEGFHLDFFYRENPYFENKSLRKTFIDPKEGNNEPMYPKGTKIDWKKDMNLTVEIVTKKKKHKGGGKTKTVKKTQPCESFYNFFNEVNVDELEEDEMQDFQESQDADMECANMLMDEIIPNAIKFYTGDADSVNPMASMFAGMDGEDGEDEDDEDHEDGVKFDGPVTKKGGEKDAECEKQQQ